MYPLRVICSDPCRTSERRTARVLAMAEKISLTNADVYETYVKVFKADAEAARHFIADQTQLGVTSDVNRWSNKIRTLRKKWAKLSKARLYAAGN